MMNENCNESFAKAFSDLECSFLLDNIKSIYVYDNYLIGSEEI